MLKKPALDWIGLDCGNLDQIVLAQRCIVYIYPHINSRGQQEEFINLLSYLTSMNRAYYNLVSSLASNGSWCTKLVKYHGLKAFSCEQLNKLIILVVLLCSLYTV